ncbi:MAG: hypothetical protein MJ159_01320 [Treponemataceae bacterium]|nr:hypothetical protein [Treponemataceae bacterium]
MKLKVILCSLVLGFFAVMSVCAEKMPKEKLKEIREYSELIVEQVNKHDVSKLVNDDYFLKVLSKELKNKNTTAEEKVYFFYLLLQKIQWAFCGGIGVPLPDNYAHNSLFQCITFNEYRKYLSKRNIDDSQFFDLVYDNMEEKPILAAYSYLLGSLVTKDIDKSFKFCKELCLLEKPTWFRSMLIHNMMLLSPSLMAVPFAEGDFEKYGLQYYSVQIHSIINCCNLKEEEKEDLIIGIFYDDNIDDFGYHIAQCILEEKNEYNDCFILTCFLLAQNRLNKESFKQFVDISLEEFEKSEEHIWKKNLVERYIKANDYSVDYYKGLNVTTGCYYKSWDGINMAAYDDGILYYDDDYAEFQPNNKN